jgi:hypothetical protein
MVILPDNRHSGFRLNTDKADLIASMRKLTSIDTKTPVCALDEHIPATA